MAYEAEGKLHKIYPTEQKTATFAAREFVLEIPEGNYPQYVKMQVVQDRCGILDNYREGEKVKVSFDLRGREWQGKYFTTLNAWKIERTEDSPVAPPPPPAFEEHFPADPFPNYVESQNTTPRSGDTGFGDLPF